MARWFTSDEHYGHANIIGYSQRPFHDLAEMNAMLVALHNRVVKPEDEVIHLGDFSLGSESNVPTILRQLNGTHILVVGNHDRAWTIRKGVETAARRYLHYGFKSIHTHLHMTLGRHHVYAEHLPLYDPQHPPIGDVKYLTLRPTVSSMRGAVAHLHGHVHRAWKTSGLCINVGVDVWDYEPVSEAKLVETIEAMLAKPLAKP